MKKRNEAKWEEMFNELIEYYSKYNSFHVPGKKLEYTKLRLWINSQRIIRNNPKYSDRRKKLEDIGFVFNHEEVIWCSRFKQLLDYKKKNGDLNITYRNKDYYELSIWLYNQKRRYRKGTMPEHRIKKLRDAGVDWL